MSRSTGNRARLNAPAKKSEKATMKKNTKAPKKVVAASKAKKPVPAKKPVAKPVVKAKAVAPAKNDKKVVAKAPEKKAAPVVVKKAAPVAPPKKEDVKKPAVVAKAPAKAPIKARVEDKVAVGKKADASPKAGASAVMKAPAPIKFEPKIIEAPQVEFKARPVDETLFTKEELEQFRELLMSERDKILVKARRAMEEGNIQIDKNEMFDEVDQASAMVEQNLTFRLLDRDRKLLSEIDHAVAKLDSGDYGYCEGTGEPIPKRRLELRPWCRHSVKFKEKLERMKKSGRGVVDEDEL